MNRGIFRAVALDRLSSPDELDRLLRVTDSKAWIAQAAVFGLLILALIWGYTGKLPSTVSGQGVIVRTGGVLNVVAAGSGVVAKLRVNAGDKIAAGQTIATVAQPSIVEKHRNALQMLEQAQRERNRTHVIREQEAKLATAAVIRKRANAEDEIKHLQDQVALAKEQVSAQEQLLAAGIVVKQKAIEARQSLTAIEDRIAGVRAQIQEFDVEEFASRAKVQQGDAEKGSAVQDAERNLHEIDNQLEIAQNVVSPYGGEVLEVKVLPGATVAMGDPIVSVQPDVQDLQALVYLPAAQAKDVHPEMEVKISPSNVKPEEFGFVRGRVVYISDFPDTPAELMRNFQNEVLVKVLTNDGPVTELRVVMLKDPNTPSGYQWSSSKGPNLLLSGGTLCTAEVITRWQKPVTLIFPALRRALGVL
jgi:HlyD family secretion protein